MTLVKRNEIACGRTRPNRLLAIVAVRNPVARLSQIRAGSCARRKKISSSGDWSKLTRFFYLPADIALNVYRGSLSGHASILPHPLARVFAKRYPSRACYRGKLNCRWDFRKRCRGITTTTTSCRSIYIGHFRDECFAFLPSRPFEGSR